MRKILPLLIMLTCLFAFVKISRADTPEQALATIASSLESGDVNAALSRFTLGEQEKSRKVLLSLDEAGRKRLATSFRGAKLKEMKSDYCLVNVPTPIPSGQVLDEEMMLVSDGNGSWMINTW